MKKNYLFLNMLLIILIAITQLFPFPIQIVDALDYKLVEGFDIYISPIRILFEPFIGPLLYYLRADQPLSEFFMLLLWIIIALFLGFLYQAARHKLNGFDIKKGFIEFIIKIPVLFCLWIALALCLIYAPLPSNIIINNTKHHILVNTHAHTQNSHDGLVTVEEQQKWHAHNGFDAFFITDHRNHRNALAARDAQRNGQLSPHPFIIAGEEASGTNHITILGLTENFQTKGMTDAVLIDTVHKMGGAAIIAHWFKDEKKSLEYYTAQGADGYEIANPGIGLTFDRTLFNKMVQHCKENGLIMNGAADYHGHGNACFVWNALEIPNWHQLSDIQKERSIVDIFRNHQQDKLDILLYHDRLVFDRDLYYLSPVYVPIGYFRTLKPLQILSWIIWIVLLEFFRPIARIFPKKNFAENIKKWGILSLICSLSIIFIGSNWYYRAQKITGDNDIYEEYGSISLLIGAGFLIYTFILLISSKKIKK